MDIKAVLESIHPSPAPYAALWVLYHGEQCADLRSAHFRCELIIHANKNNIALHEIKVCVEAFKARESLSRWMHGLFRTPLGVLKGAEIAQALALNLPTFQGPVEKWNSMHHQLSSYINNTSGLNITQEVHSRIRGFFMRMWRWSHENQRTLLSVELVYASGTDDPDEMIRTWRRDEEPALFAEAVHFEELAARIVKIASDAANTKAPGKHNFEVRCWLLTSGCSTLTFSLSPNKTMTVRHTLYDQAVKAHRIGTEAPAPYATAQESQMAQAAHQSNRTQEVHNRIRSFLMREWRWSHKNKRALVTVELIYTSYTSAGDDRDEMIRTWRRDEEPALFAEAANFEKLAAHIVKIASDAADTKAPGKLDFKVRCPHPNGSFPILMFSLSPRDRDHEDRALTADDALSDQVCMGDQVTVGKAHWIGPAQPAPYANAQESWTTQAARQLNALRDTLVEGQTGAYWFGAFTAQQRAEHAGSSKLSPAAKDLASQIWHWELVLRREAQHTLDRDRAVTVRVDPYCDLND